MKLKPYIAVCLTLLLASMLAPFTSQARYLNPATGRFWTMDSFEGDQEDPLTLHKYLYAADNPVNLTDPSGHDPGVMSAIGITVVNAIQMNSRTLAGVPIAAFKARALQTLTFKLGAWAIISATAGTTISAVVVVVAASSTDDQEVNEEIEAQIEQAKQQKKNLRFFHYTPRTYEELGAGLFPGQFGALRGNLYYYEARDKLGVGDPKYVYPVDIDPLVTPVIPRGLVPRGGYGFGGEPQVEFPIGTPPGSVQKGRQTYK